MKVFAGASDPTVQSKKDLGDGPAGRKLNEKSRQGTTGIAEVNKEQVLTFSTDLTSTGRSNLITVNGRSGNPMATYTENDGTVRQMRASAIQVHGSEGSLGSLVGPGKEHLYSSLGCITCEDMGGFIEFAKGTEGNRGSFDLEIV